MALVRTTSSCGFFNIVLRPPINPLFLRPPNQSAFHNSTAHHVVRHHRADFKCKIKTPQPYQFRYYSESQSTKSELASGSFSDPTRPNLFYHFLEPPTPLSEVVPVYALSFLSSVPSPDSSTIIGWLPAQTQSHTDEAGLNDFQENPKFRQLLHEAVKRGLDADVDDIQRNGALQLQQGWMHIHDDRNIPALGRIGDVDDIIASVLVEDGKIKPETYQPMPSYRLCTSDGITQLTDGLREHLRKFLMQRVEMEKKGL